MTAPSTFVVTGTFVNPDGVTPAAGGTITLQPSVARFDNNGNVINAVATTAVLDGSGTLGAGVTLIQCTSGYDVTIALPGVPVRTQHIAGTANLSITPSAPGTVTYTGKWYGSNNALAAGTIQFTRTSTGAVTTSTLDGSGTLGAGTVLPLDAAGYDVVEKITGRATTPSYHVAGTASLDLGTV